MSANKRSAGSILCKCDPVHSQEGKLNWRGGYLVRCEGRMNGKIVALEETWETKVDESHPDGFTPGVGWVG